MGEVLNECAAFIQVVLIALNEYATVVLIAVTVGLFLATKNMARSTKLLADESRKLREDAKKPQVSAKLKPMAEHGAFIQLVLNNLGRGAALNVKFRLEGE